MSCPTCACGRRSVPVPSSHCILLLNVDSGGGGGSWGTPACLGEKKDEKLHVKELKGIKSSVPQQADGGLDSFIYCFCPGGETLIRANRTNGKHASFNMRKHPVQLTQP